MGTGSFPSSILGVRKLVTLGYPTVKTASFCIPRFDTIPQCDGRTDGRKGKWMDGYAVAYTALAKLDLRCAVNGKSKLERRKCHYT